MSTRRKRLTRRALIAGGSLAGCCVVAAGGLGAISLFVANDATSNIGALSFTTPLSIPPLLDGVADDQGRRVFELTLQTGGTRIVPAGGATTWGVNGPLLGPTLRVRRGDVVVPVVHNELPEETTIHWHGMHLPAAMDGGPHQMIPVGERWRPEWTVEQPPATLLYHPHPHGKTAEHVYKGVAGLILVDDDDSDRLDLPREYGVDDVPLIIQDRNFTGNGELSLETGGFLAQLGGSANFGILGDTILVNGTFDPHFAVTRTLTRFRVLNGSNARFYNLGFTDDRPFHLIATDNGFVSGAPVELTRLLLGPGERGEIVVAFTGGDDVVLRSFEQDVERQVGGNDTFDLIAFRALESLEPSPPLADDLGSSDETPPVPPDTRERTFELNGHGRINDREMDLSRIDEVVPAGALEIWHVKSSGSPHTFHIHGATFHVLEVDGQAPPPHLRGPKDTVRVDGNHPVKLAVQFDSHTDPDTPYMFHCHLLRHEDNGRESRRALAGLGSMSDGQQGCRHVQSPALWGSAASTACYAPGMIDRPQDLEQDDPRTRREARDLLHRAGLPADELVPGGGIANDVWLTSRHVVRLNSGRFRDAFRYEAQVLRMLPAEIPHPIVVAHGARDGGEFLILERLPGTTIDEAWSSLTTASRRAVVGELAGIMRHLHALEPAAWMENPWVADAAAGRYADAYHAPPSLYRELLDSARRVRPDASDVLERTRAFIARRIDAFAGDRDVPVHTDLHFRNVLVNGGRISGLVDFEGFRLAPADVELDMLLRSIRWSLASPMAGSMDYEMVPHWFREVYPELFTHPRLIERLEVYDALWQLVQLHWHPEGSASDPAVQLESVLNGQVRETMTDLLHM